MLLAANYRRMMCGIQHQKIPWYLSRCFAITLGVRPKFIVYRWTEEQTTAVKELQTTRKALQDVERNVSAMVHLSNLNHKAYHLPVECSYDHGLKGRFCMLALCMQRASIAEDDVASANLARLDALQHERVQLKQKMQSRLMLHLASTEQQLGVTQDTFTVEQVSIVPKASVTVSCSSTQNECSKDKQAFQ